MTDLITIDLDQALERARIVRLFKGDCLEVMRSLDDNSVDLVVCDLPYGVTSQRKWDNAIPLEPLWLEYERVTKVDAAIVLTATQPFTSALVMSRLRSFKHEWIWKKNEGSGFANAKRRPMVYHESVLVFSRGKPIYNPQPTKRTSEASIKQTMRPVRSGSAKSNHNLGMKTIHRQYDPHTKGPESVLFFDCVPNGGGGKLHPTQKPITLFEYLIRTYSNEGQVVLDNTMGSGTTGVAAVNTGREFIGIELDAEYFKIAKRRIKEAERARA